MNDYNWREYSNRNANGVEIPCKRDCKDRKVGCHSKCEKYKEYTILNEEIKEKRRKESVTQAVVYGFNSKRTNDIPRPRQRVTR